MYVCMVVCVIRRQSSVTTMMMDKERRRQPGRLRGRRRQGIHMCHKMPYGSRQSSRSSDRRCSLFTAAAGLLALGLNAHLSPAPGHVSSGVHAFAMVPPNVHEPIARRIELPTFSSHRFMHRCGSLRMNYVDSASSNDQPRQQQDGMSHPEAPSNHTNTTSSGRPRRRSSKAYITPDLISDLKHNTPLTSVVESYNLPGFRRTSPSRAVCLCPFHDDNNPSMHVDDERGLYKCFSCGVGGDVFNFVREYRNTVEGNTDGKEMGFREAVEFVANEFGSVNGLDLSVSAASRLAVTDANKDGGGESTEERRQQIEAERIRCERLALANAAAADYYGKCLASHPEAGAARSHLRSRDIKPETVRRYALGYAPDAYFGPSVMRTKRKRRGQDSLVEKLREMGFTSEEMIEAGLAIRTDRKNKGRSQAVVHSDTESTTKSADVPNEDKEDGQRLMDRFRGRLVVPIFDGEGRKVIGFGGRHIELPDAQSSKYTPAKYLNSPESPIFSKKTLLFGVHEAKKAIGVRREKVARMTLGSAPLMEKQRSSADNTVAIVVVEGYFDAIALACAGVEEAVASMGTSLTQEQLEVASRTVGSRGSRIVICFDADDAGQNAIERLCENRLLTKISEEREVEIHIAGLPEDFKDPADFVQARGGEAFRKEVLAATIPWSDWYIDRLASSFKQGENATETQPHQSFNEVCDRVSTFLATLTDQTDRAQRAYTAAATLARSMSSEDTKVSASSLQIRIESDLLDMAATKASARDAIAERIERIESVDGEVYRPLGSPGALITKMSSGEGLTSLINDHEVDSNLFSDDQRGSEANGSARNGKQSKRKVAAASYEYHESRNGGNRRWQGKQQKRGDEPPLTPHFAGFEFVNPTDAAWLGIHNSKSQTRQKNAPLVAGGGRETEQRLMREALEAGEAYVRIGDMKNQIVYFNSNTFLGHKFLTQEAREAGYGEDGVVYDGSQIGLGIPALVAQDADILLRDAEKRLLETLLHFPSARAAMKGAVGANVQSDTALIEWSDSGREWLFDCLMDSRGLAPLPSELQEGGTAKQLRDHLASLPGAPLGAFHEQFNMSSYTENDFIEFQGALDGFFILKDEATSKPSSEEYISRETRAELAVQETLASILRATALKRAAILKKRWLATAHALEVRVSMLAQNNTIITHEADSHPQFADMRIEELQTLSSNLGERFAEALQTVQELDESAKRIGSRLMDYCNSDGAEYRMSNFKQEKLAKMMDEHLASLPEDPKPESPGDDGQYIFGIDEYDDAIDEKFGGQPSARRVVHSSSSSAESTGRYEAIEDVDDEDIFE